MSLVRRNPLGAKGVAIGAAVVALVGLAGFAIYKMMKKSGKPADASIEEITIKVGRPEVA